MLNRKLTCSYQRGHTDVVSETLDISQAFVLGCQYTYINRLNINVLRFISIKTHYRYARRYQFNAYFKKKRHSSRSITFLKLKKKLKN